MSKLHFANLSFDEKSSDTLRENEKYLTVTQAAPNPVLFYAAISNFLVLRVRAE